DSAASPFVGVRVDRAPFATAKTLALYVVAATTKVASRPGFVTWLPARGEGLNELHHRLSLHPLEVLLQIRLMGGETFYRSVQSMPHRIVHVGTPYLYCASSASRPRTSASLTVVLRVTSPPQPFGGRRAKPNTAGFIVESSRAGREHLFTTARTDVVRRTRHRTREVDMGLLDDLVAGLGKQGAVTGRLGYVWTAAGAARWWRNEQGQEGRTRGRAR